MFEKLLTACVALLVMVIPALSPAEAEKGEVQYGNVWTTENGTQYYTCPVMKEEGSIDQSMGNSDKNGLRYLLCCPSCQAPFRANPEKYTAELFLPANIVRVDENGIKTFKDPVNKEEAIVKKDTRFLDVDGLRYFFIADSTMKKFNQDIELPSKSVNKQPYK